MQYNMFQIDTGIMNLVLAFRNEWLTKLMIFFTYLGDWQVIVGLAVAAIIILARLKKTREIIFLAAALISGELIKELLKLLIRRQRPDAVFSLISENGYSFPSGHALMSVVFYGAIAYFIYKLYQKMWQKIVLAAVFAALIFLIGFSRVYLGVHWVSDVVAGWLVGFLILIFLILIFKRYFTTLNQK